MILVLINGLCIKNVKSIHINEDDSVVAIQTDGIENCLHYDDVACAIDNQGFTFLTD